MKLRTVKYIIREGFANTWRNKLMCLASMGIVTAALIIFGIFLLISANIKTLGEQIESNQKVQAFLAPEINQKETDQVRIKIESFGLAKNIEFESKEQALDKLKKSEIFKGHERLLEGYTAKNNPLRASYIITLKKAEDGDKLVKLLGGIPEIKKVNYFKGVLDNIVRIMKVVRLVSLIAIVLLGATSVFIIANTIKLTVFARRKEIGIMKYIGATDWFIRWPFIIESVVIGVLASLIALAVVSDGYQAVVAYLSRKDVSADIGLTNFVAFSAVSHDILMTYLIIGIGIACLGSALSIRKYLRV